MSRSPYVRPVSMHIHRLDHPAPAPNWLSRPPHAHKRLTLPTNFPPIQVLKAREVVPFDRLPFSVRAKSPSIPNDGGEGGEISSSSFLPLLSTHQEIASCWRNKDEMTTLSSQGVSSATPPRLSQSGTKYKVQYVNNARIKEANEKPR